MAIQTACFLHPAALVGDLQQPLLPPQQALLGSGATEQLAVRHHGLEHRHQLGDFLVAAGLSAENHRSIDGQAAEAAGQGDEFIGAPHGGRLAQAEHPHPQAAIDRRFAPDPAQLAAELRREREPFEGESEADAAHHRLRLLTRLGIEREYVLHLPAKLNAAHPAIAMLRHETIQPGGVRRRRHIAAQVRFLGLDALQHPPRLHHQRHAEDGGV